MAEIPAFYMRGGASKGLFFLADDLPSDPAGRDDVLLRVIGSPDPYGTQADGLGGATSSAGNVVLVRRSQHAGCDVDYLFGAVAIRAALIDWSGRCDDLSAAVGPFAIWRGFVPARDSITTVRMWQQNTGEAIVARVPCRNGHPLEAAGLREAGVPFPAAEIVLDYSESDSIASAASSASAPASTSQPLERALVRSSARRLMTGLVHVPERC
ncbi:PrpF domain-containing protein [Cupriavidus sp. 2TAF22]|uniref:PrpF domain-containing protein n=1 Tax=unclassified Cupriavidus TaxID=2640874 RepID=UPI003F9206A2